MKISKNEGSFKDIGELMQGVKYNNLLRMITLAQKQKIRLANARRIKRREQIEALMKFIDAKLEDKKQQIYRSKLQLINCQLCSLA